jgi:hypothetical protein
VQDNSPKKLFAIPQIQDKYYILYAEETFRGISALTRYLGSGHACGYIKPYLAEAEKGRISSYKEIQYGGKRAEDFLVKEIISDAKMIHCLGFRQQHPFGSALPPLQSPVVLYYAGYDLEKKKVTQNHNIYEINYDWGSYDFGPLSMACKNDKVYIAFSFHKYPYRGAPQNNIQQIASDVYYFQHGNKAVGNAVKIADGFGPLAKLDSTGNVHIFWVDYNGNLVCKTKENDKWSEDSIILTGVDMLSKITFSRCVLVEFDSENNLHIVYPSNGDMVYAKIKPDFTALRK